MKGPSRKQVIIFMSNELGKRFIKDSVFHITNINFALKSIKFNVCADFIYADNKGIIISTNNVVSNSDLQEIEKYIKNSLQTNDDNIASSWLPQSKSYLKIIGIPYFIDKLNTHFFWGYWMHPQEQPYFQWYYASIKTKNHQGFTQVRHGNHLDWYLGHLKW